jgi:hypothetical protein
MHSTITRIHSRRARADSETNGNPSKTQNPSAGGLWHAVCARQTPQTYNRIARTPSAEARSPRLVRLNSGLRAQVTRQITVVANTDTSNHRGIMAKPITTAEGESSVHAMCVMSVRGRRDVRTPLVAFEHLGTQKGSSATKRARDPRPPRRKRGRVGDAPVVPQNLIRRELLAAMPMRVIKRTELGPLRAADG